MHILGTQKRICRLLWLQFSALPIINRSQTVPIAVSSLPPPPGAMFVEITITFLHPHEALPSAADSATF